MDLTENAALLCLVIQSSKDNEIGRTRLQKMIYFADRYFGWNVGDYKLHYYGPYSRNIATTLETINDELIKETIPELGPYAYELTDEGNEFLDSFCNVSDKVRIETTRSLFTELSGWTKDELELAATIDFVQKNTPGIEKKDLIEKVNVIKDNFSRESIEYAYEKWIRWKKGT